MSQLAARYATALFEVTKANGSTDQVLETLLGLSQSLVENKDILELLKTPLISDTEKVGVLKTAVGNGLTDELGTFFQLLIKNNRLGELPQIAKAYQEKLASDLGVESGVVKSAVELSEDEKNNVKKTIEEKLSKKVNLEFTIDSQMIGGIEAKVGSYIFEDSIKSHMQKLNDFITRRVQ